MTVIDISNLERLMYCFPDKEGPWFSLSAGQYYTSYLRAPHVGLPDEQFVPSDWEGSESQARDQEVVKRLSRYTLFPRTALQNLLSEQSTNIDQVHDSQENLCTHVKSLREITLDSFFGFAIDGLEFSLDDLAEVRQLSYFGVELRKRLRRRARINCLPSSPNTTILFEVAFSGISHLSLSEFSFMTAEWLLKAAFGILRDNHIWSIDLSNLTQLSETDIAKILDAGVSLKQFYLMNMPHVSTGFAFLCQARLGSDLEVYHSDLLGLPFTYTPLLITNLKSTIQTPRLILGRHSPIKHLVLTRVFTDHENPLRSKDGGCTVDWGSYQHTSEFDHRGQPHAGQMHQMIIPLHDMNLYPRKLVTAVANFFHSAYYGRRQSPGPLATNQIASVMATAFATDTSFTMIHQLPETLFNISTHFLLPWHGNLWPVPCLPLKPGEWAVVVVNVDQMDGIKDQPQNFDMEGTPNASVSQTEQLHRQVRENYRLAIITPRTEDAQSGYRVESMESFLKEITGKELGKHASDITRAIERWKNQVGSIETCAEEEITSLLPVLEVNSEIMMKSQEMRFVLKDERKWEDRWEDRRQNYISVDSN
ncbi:MAG: hypothetical protein Q9219_006946 [cf. Caloplaca sp. 3 TL-2023]